MAFKGSNQIRFFVKNGPDSQFSGKSEKVLFRVFKNSKIVVPFLSK